LQNQAYTRLSFEEFFLFQLPLALRKIKRKEKPGIAHKIDRDFIKSFVEFYLHIKMEQRPEMKWIKCIIIF